MMALTTAQIRATINQLKKVDHAPPSPKKD